MIENVKCPKCSGPMKSRLNKRTDQRFWGCADFPKCNGTRDTDGEAPKDYNNYARSYDNSRGEPEDDLPSERQRSNDRRRW